MAQELDDGEFWLPPQFLTDDDILMDFKEQPSKESAEKVFGFENGAGFGLFRPKSDLSSPGESVNGSTETESDEEDFLAGLTRKMANSTLNDDMWKIDSKKSWGISTSPQSTLCNVMGTYSCQQGSSRGSPTCPSPPATGGTNHRSDGAWDLLYAAAGEVARMKMAEQAVPVSGFTSNNRGFIAAPRKPTPISVPIKTQTPNLGFHSGNQPLPYHQLQAVQFQQLKQQQMFKQQQQQQYYQQGQHHHHHQQVIHNRGRNGPNNNTKPLGLSMSAWPTLQQSQQPQGQQSQPQPPQPQPGSGMRAVFLGNPAAKRECSGTGVFLPRQIGTQPESRKKRGGCSTVLLPDRVVQALNLNLDAMEAPPQSQPQPRIHSPDYEADLRYRSALLAQQQQQRRTIRHVRPQPGPIENNEFRLPQEWTY